MDSKKFAIVLLTYLIDSVASEDALCYNGKKAVYECCHDYKNVSGTCEACIGFWGKECSNNCSYGYYGHGCRTLCNCNYQQICDPIQGCIAENSVDEPSNLTNCSEMEKVYNILTSAHGINICYNSMTEKIECCAGFTNITGICEKNFENFTEKVEFTTNNAGNSRCCSEERRLMNELWILFTQKETQLDVTLTEEEEELFEGYTFMVCCVLSALLGSTWLIVTVFVIYKKGSGNSHQSSTRDTHDIRLETRTFTQNYQDAQFTDAWDLYTELGSPYHGIPDTTYEQPKT